MGGKGSKEKGPGRKQQKVQAELLEAVKSNCVTSVERALDSGKADVNFHYPEWSGRTALHLAVWDYFGGRSNPEITKVLLDAGADVNARNEMMDTPLHTACVSASHECVRLLCTAGADVYAKTDKVDGQRTPMQKCGLSPDASKEATQLCKEELKAFMGNTSGNDEL
uniref:Uncharacterized protein n=1 Tax=Chromera velia CCMP2878 TaxID=1169474 RepID=A0A0G4FY64_9ALVE|eukprot:Cvel_19263.t1-p1 / transcript=Cvel_19263.t1 / gene=Cvel_19263 / organism=Chromera_velia_CCMP2878 / gene_product=Protein phosphatase 1 regulatory subunit 16A, putative / transcript_product=Protein phosphatase 1 regulatory subunit 16A, putative / location=Cvel_scaffold1649:10121-10618(+) / protein_length=166 / sequence_SO=supercontig / SO=protein_coding / is_pseudo=false